MLAHLKITSQLIRKLYQAAEKCETPVGKEQSEDPAVMRLRLLVSLRSKLPRRKGFRWDE